MSRHFVQTRERTYLFSPGDQLPLGGCLWALIRARVIDELTGRPPVTAINLESDLTPTSSRVAGDGLVGLVGVPRHVFQSLASRNYSVRLTVQAVGYILRRATVVILNDQRTVAAPAPLLNATVMTLNDTARLSVGETLLVGPVGPTMVAVQIRALGPVANQVTCCNMSTATPGLPHVYAVGDPVVPVVQDDFAPTDLGDLAMHREPTVITGRAVQANGGAPTPLAGAIIRVTGIWRTPPPANMSVLPDPPNLVSLQPPLYADRAVVTGRLQPRDLPPIAGDDKLLLEDVLAGANPLRLSNRQNLALGDILLIDAGQPDLAEFLAISAMSGASTADQPAHITLDYPVTRAHRRNAVIQKVSPQPLGAMQQFTVEALAGDTCVFLDDVAGLAAANEVQITGGTSPDEYHNVKSFSATSDTDGYYRLPPLSRVAQVEIHAEKTVGTDTFSSEKTEFRPDYNLRENRLDLTLTLTV